MPEPTPTTWRTDPVPQELVELHEQICSLPGFLRDRLMPLCERAGQHAQLQSRLVRIAQTAVDQLQIDVKYLMFDVEATRRERDSYKRQLEKLFED